MVWALQCSFGEAVPGFVMEMRLRNPCSQKQVHGRPAKCLRWCWKRLGWGMTSWQGGSLELWSAASATCWDRCLGMKLTQRKAKLSDRDREIQRTNMLSMN